MAIFVLCRTEYDCGDSLTVLVKDGYADAPEGARRVDTIYHSSKQFPMQVKRAKQYKAGFTPARTTPAAEMIANIETVETPLPIDGDADFQKFIKGALRHEITPVPSTHRWHVDAYFASHLYIVEIDDLEAFLKLAVDCQLYEFDDRDIEVLGIERPRYMLVL